MKFVRIWCEEMKLKNYLHLFSVLFCHFIIPYTAPNFVLVEMFIRIYNCAGKCELITNIYRPEAMAYKALYIYMWIYLNQRVKLPYCSIYI